MTEEYVLKEARRKLPDPDSRKSRDEVNISVIGWKLIAMPPWVVKIRENIRFRRVVIHISWKENYPVNKYKWEVINSENTT